MGHLRVRILGNGGCLNNGLPYNAFVVNTSTLVEAPPDIMLSLNRAGLAVDDIDTVYISHLHGDHTFGLPFVIINKWISDHLALRESKLKIIGPRGIEEYTGRLVETAFTTDHPCYRWLKSHAVFEEIDGNYKTSLGDLHLSCFELEHLIETHGFLLSGQGKPVFAYIADTRWCGRVEDILKKKPRIVLMDMNGGGANIHISVEDVVEKGLAITGEGVTFYGTHLADEFESPVDNIKCARPGEEIVIEY